MSEPSPYRHSANGAKPAVVQSALMKQPNTQQLRALRLSALARDNKVVNAIRSSISQAPDALVKELMDVHWWPAHEAPCSSAASARCPRGHDETGICVKQSLAAAKIWLGDCSPIHLLPSLEVRAHWHSMHTRFVCLRCECRPLQGHGIRRSRQDRPFHHCRQATCRSCIA